MCGRFSLDTTKAEIARKFKCDNVALSHSRFNIAPSQNITTIINAEETNEAILMRWGLIPSWVKSLDSWKSNLINARVETIEKKPSFRNGFKKRPCLIPVTGFYEWSKDKQPYYFNQNKSLFALAGIWETWTNAEEKILSCTILTAEAKGAIADIHHRMPVVIPSEYYDLWLGELDGAECANRQAPELYLGELGRKELIEALPEVELQFYPVSKTVNSPKNDNLDCIKPISRSVAST